LSRLLYAVNSYTATRSVDYIHLHFAPSGARTTFCARVSRAESVN
jgi:hypothetical protein